MKNLKVASTFGAPSEHLANKKIETGAPVPGKALRKTKLENGIWVWRGDDCNVNRSNAWRFRAIALAKNNLRSFVKAELRSLFIIEND